MKRNSLLPVLLGFGLSLLSCSYKSYDERQVVGQWFSTEWLRNGENTEMRAWFNFMEDKTYRAVIEKNQEEGTWWISGNKLYTQVEGEERVVVGIERLDDGNLHLKMNRGGQSELLVMVRAQ
jgi:hypothetical protein